MIKNPIRLTRKKPLPEAQILARHTRMPVLEAEQNLKVELDHVYVTQPNVSMRISEGQLGPREMSGGAAPNRSIVRVAGEGGWDAPDRHGVVGPGF